MSLLILLNKIFVQTFQVVNLLRNYDYKGVYSVQINIIEI